MTYEETLKDNYIDAYIEAQKIREIEYPNREHKGYFTIFYDDVNGKFTHSMFAYTLENGSRTNKRCNIALKTPAMPKLKSLPEGAINGKHFTILVPEKFVNGGRVLSPTRNKEDHDLLLQYPSDELGEMFVAIGEEKETMSKPTKFVSLSELGLGVLDVVSLYNLRGLFVKSSSGELTPFKSTQELGVNELVSLYDKLYVEQPLSEKDLFTQQFTDIIGNVSPEAVERIHRAFDEGFRLTKA